KRAMATMRAAMGSAVSPSDLAALKADLGRLNEVAPGLGDRAVRHVADGTDTSVLLEIKGLGSAAVARISANYEDLYQQHTALRRRALVDVEEWRPAVLHRFAVLIETMQDAAGQYRYGNVDPKAPGWLRLLLAQVSYITRTGHGRVTEPSVKPFYSMHRL